MRTNTSITPAQNIAPMTVSITHRQAELRSVSGVRDRLRTVRSLGDSTCANDGAGSPAGPAPSLGIEHLDQLARRTLAGQLQEVALESAKARCFGRRHELGYRARRANLAALDDRDAVAHVFRHLERVRGHEDGVAAPRVLLEQILEDARRFRIEAHHRLVH